MTRRPTPTAAITLAVLVAVGVSGCTPLGASRPETGYPWHTGIVATTFWVGEIFDPGAADGSQRFSTYDSRWLDSYGGCDGILDDGGCRTEARTPTNDYFPTSMTPRENPFYLDLPFDDVNDPEGFATRGDVVPWADRAPYATVVDDRSQSLMKNRWVVLHRDGRLCYGQIQDAGPGEYRDAAYVFGDDDRRPANTRYGGAGLDVSPALNGCLGFTDLDGDDDRVDWAFVDDADVPAGPWTRIVTDSPVR
ncbi:hypothetical protein [Microbacterium sp.]|uniref:hypothetical protein n=1 Tax=Microbacterium sp. TaxID=51671 RepID=UPI003919917F